MRQSGQLVGRTAAELPDGDVIHSGGSRIPCDLLVRRGQIASGWRLAEPQRNDLRFGLAIRLLPTSPRPRLPANPPP